MYVSENGKVDYDGFAKDRARLDAYLDTLGKIVNEENRVILERLLARAKRIGQAGEQTVLRREYADGSAVANESLPVARRQPLCRKRLITKSAWF
jgi:hypothetical protein